jgi:hypothetical protein
MMSFEMSCVPSFERVGILYGKNGGMPLHQEFHYKPFVRDLKGPGFRYICGGYSST